MFEKFSRLDSNTQDRWFELYKNKIDAVGGTKKYLEVNYLGLKSEASLQFS